MKTCCICGTEMITVEKAISGYDELCAECVEECRDFDMDPDEVIAAGGIGAF